MANQIRSPQTELNCEETPDDPRCGDQAVPGTTELLATPTTVWQDSTATQNPAEGSSTIQAIRTTAVLTDDEFYTKSTFAVFTSPTIAPSRVLGPQATSISSGDNGVSKGAVAGIAVGTYIVGAVMAILLAWFLVRRRDKRYVQKMCPSGYPIYADSSPELAMVQKSAAAASSYVQVSHAQMRNPIPVPAQVPAAIASHDGIDPLADILPVAANEQEIASRVSALFAQSYQHIDTYYRDVHASITPSMDPDLASFGQYVDMLELLQDCSSPTVALKHALVVFILSVTGPKRDDSTHTLWPEELSHLTYSQTSESIQLSTARALHRRLAVYLYAQQNPLTPNNSSQARLSNSSKLSLTRKTSDDIREAAEHFSLTFFPWANPTFGDQERERDLIGLITEALECRIWLYSQASEWILEWEGSDRGLVVVAPALVVREAYSGPRRVVLEQAVLAT